MGKDNQDKETARGEPSKKGGERQTDPAPDPGLFELELREALHLEKLGRAPSREEEDSILRMVQATRAALPATLPEIVLAIFEEGLRLISGDSHELPEPAYRGDASQAVRVNRSHSGRGISIVFSQAGAGRRDEVLLSVYPEDGDDASLTVEAVQDGTTVETLNLRQKKMFSSSFDLARGIELVVKASGKRLYSVPIRVDRDARGGA